jgi:hypothetical protein
MHLKSLIITIVIITGIWCIFWNPIEYLDEQLGTTGVTVIGVVILLVAVFVWRKKVF